MDSLGLPWNIPQSMRIRARSVVSRNCEPVTVVAPPRNWICMATMVTARAIGRVSSGPMGVAGVERAYGELLAAFGDLVVAETRGEPADPPSGSTLALRRRYRARRRAVGAALDEVAAGRMNAADRRAVTV